MAKQWHQIERLDHKSLKKAQLDREKAAKEAQVHSERKKTYFIVGVIVFAIICTMVFASVVKRRATQQAFEEERAKLLKTKVIETAGSTLGRALGTWRPVEQGFVFSDDHYFKTEKEGFLVVELQLDNRIKLFQNSEIKIARNTLADNENRVIKESAHLKDGEISVAISREGREILEIEAGGVIAVGASGLFKVIYNRQDGTGEVVVKNGLVEIIEAKNSANRVKVSGFYKVTFSDGKIANPTQASVIQYNWR